MVVINKIKCYRCSEVKDISCYRNYSKGVCYDCVLRRNREKWKLKRLAQGKSIFTQKNYYKTGIKICTGCKKELPISKFRLATPKTSNRLLSMCRECEYLRYKEYEKIHKDTINANRRKRRKDPYRGIIFSLRSRQKSLFERNKFSKGYKTTKVLREWLGCDVCECIKYIEDKFIEGMSWTNRGIGKGKWQIDHKIPISLTELENGKIKDTEFNRRIWHYTNLQPLWHIDNAKKSNKYDTSIQISMVNDYRNAS